MTRLFVQLLSIFVLIPLTIINCSALTECPNGQFDCGDGECIDQRLVCDGFVDCRRLPDRLDGLDELQCDECLPDVDLLTLPRLDLLTDSGYNLAKGGFSVHRILQSERYGSECRTLERTTFGDQTVIYRLPDNIKDWQFYDEPLIPSKFEFHTYGNSYIAAKETELRRTWKSMDSDEVSELTLDGDFGDDIGDGLREYWRTNRHLFASGLPLTRLGLRVITGTFRQKSIDQLHLHRGFATKFREAVRLALHQALQAERRFVDVFEKFGTHLITSGSFGGFYELYAYQECDGNSTVDPGRYLKPEELAPCASAMLNKVYTKGNNDQRSDWSLPECSAVVSRLARKVGPRLYDVLSLARAVGGSPTARNALQNEAKFRDLPDAFDRSTFSDWMVSLDERPAPVQLNFTSICRLVPAAEGGEICQTFMSNYLRRFPAGDSQRVRRVTCQTPIPSRGACVGDQSDCDGQSPMGGGSDRKSLTIATILGGLCVALLSRTG